MTSSTCRRSVRGVLLCFLCLTPFAAATAAAPRDELLRFVPADVGFCLVVQDLRGQSASLLASDFVRHFRESALGQSLSKDAEVRKLADFDKLLQKSLGIDSARLRDDILGDAVVLAYRPGPPGKPEQEQGLVLLRARDAQLLAQVMQRINQEQRKSGEVKEIHVREHNGRKYQHRVELKGDNYYYLDGPVLIVSPQEAMLRQALDRDRTAPAAEVPPVTEQLRRLGADQALAALWINPQAFTAEVEWKASRAPQVEAAALKHFLVYWKALDGIALTANMTRDFEFRLAFRAKTELPPAARKLLTEPARPSELWARFPDDALLATAGRIDAAALLEMLDGFLTAETRKTLHDSLDRNIGAVLGRNGVREVLPSLGPDWGLCITAPPAADKGWFPQAVLALRARAGDKGAPMDQALLSAIHSYALLAVVGHNRLNKDQLVLKTARLDKIEVRYLTSEQSFPPGLQPAFALHDGYLLLASSPEAIRRFGSAPAAPSPAPSPLPLSPAAGERGRGEGTDVPLLRMSLKDLRRYVAERREPLVVAGAERNQVSKEEARRGVDGLLSVLQLFDRLELSQRTADGQVTLTLRLQPVHAARK